MREVLLRLRTTHYERASELADAVRERAERVLRTARALGDELRTSLERARELAAPRAAARGAGGAPGATSPSPAPGQALGRQLRGLGELREKGEGLAGALTEGSLPRLMTLAGPFAPALGGALLTLLAPVVDRVTKELEARFEARLAARESALLARLDEERLRADYARRLAEDPRFAREQARAALADTLREERWAGPRIDRAAADLLTDELGP